MKHYAIIKRNINKMYPKWEELYYNALRRKIVKYESFDYKLFHHKYYNVIVDCLHSVEYSTYWKGYIKHDVLDIDDTLIVDGEEVVILNVLKNIDGTVEYWIDDVFEKVDNYEELLAECELKYNNYIEKRKESEVNSWEDICISESKDSDNLLDKIKKLFK